MVGYSSSTGKYQASLQILGKLIFLGEYKSYKEAILAEEAVTKDTDNLLCLHLAKSSYNRKL